MNIFLTILSTIAIILSLLPKSRSQHWFVRGQSNFRAPYLALDILLFIWVVMASIPFLLKFALAIMLLISIYVCINSVAPYSPLFPKKIKDATVDRPKQELSILIHNVYQYNDKYDALTDMINREDPDVVLLLETNADWDNAMSGLYEKYNHVVKKIQENTYGIILMSKIEVKEGGVNHMVKANIPSVEALIKVCGRPIRIIGIHPEPPIPGEVLSSKPKDKELIRTADYIEQLDSEELIIVIGDLNDVAWSRISQKFKKITGLKDPRIGRGFYSTFPTYSPIKIPLDHVFCSPSFKLIDFDTLEEVGSDHHPVVVKFQVPSISSN